MTLKQSFCQHNSSRRETHRYANRWIGKELTMADETLNEHVEATPEEARQGMKGADILAVLAVSTFLAAVGLITFFITATISN